MNPALSSFFSLRFQKYRAKEKESWGKFMVITLGGGAEVTPIEAPDSWPGVPGLCWGPSPGTVS